VDLVCLGTFAACCGHEMFPVCEETALIAHTRKPVSLQTGTTESGLPVSLHHKKLYFFTASQGEEKHK